MQAGLTEIAAPFLREKGLARESRLLRHLVAPHALREFDDRRAAAQDAHVLPRDRPRRGLVRHGPRGHPLHARRGQVSGGLHRAAEVLSGRTGSAPEAEGEVQDRRSLERRPGHAGNGQEVSRHLVRRSDLGGGGQFVQTPCRDLHQGGRDPERAHGRGAVRRQSRFRLHRVQGCGHAQRVHRSPQAALRRHAVPARPLAG